ncbi:MAG TPA: pilus assembly PilX N-terminal domain-containing protein [Gaiellaceae bacterium]|nr:pilus assembly PilX N-terminal domain-containing protein [Gaiellaceae bacterium]
MSILQRSPAARRPVRAPATFRLPRRLQDESGIALVMALAIILVLTVLVTATLAFTSSNSRDASLKQAGQSAYALAEAGLSQAKAQLYQHYYNSSGNNYDSSGNAINNGTVYSSTWFTGAGIPSSQQSPSSSAACTSTSTCMSWSVVSWTPSGPGPWTKGTLVFQGQGRVPNPTGGTALTRTVTTTIYVEQLPGLQGPNSVWTELYTGATGQPCDLQLGQKVNANAPIYVAGNLCLTSAASIEGSLVNLTVLGNIRLQNGGADIGQVTPVKSVKVGGGCVKSNNGSYVTPCPINTSSTAIFDQSGRTTAPSPTAQSPPTIDWSGIASRQAASTVSCTNGVSLASATFYLTPPSGAGSTGYTCTITDPISGKTVGSIAYNSTAHTLAFSGEVYLSGSLDLSTPSAITYTGLSSLFVAGAVTAANGSTLCVHVSGSSCDFANATNTSSSNYWDATKSVLIIESQGAMGAGNTLTNLNFQGGLYSATSINLGGGQSSTQGPLVSPQIIVPGQQLNLSFPNFPFVMSDSGTNSPPAFSLSSSNGSY